MSEIIQIAEDSPTIVQVFTDLTINASGSSNASGVAVSPSIPGLMAGTVQEAVVAQQAAIVANHTAILALQALPPPELKSLPDLSMVGAADGAIVTYKTSSQGFELRNDLQNIVIDGGNF